MAIEYWILIIVAAVIVAALLGFYAGRASAPAERRIREMARERDAARSEAEEVRGEVARHFDESARMFGRLAQDYRAFFEHFAETAQNLGMSEGRARELLHRADPGIAEDEHATGEAIAEDADWDPGERPHTSAAEPASEGASEDEHAHTAESAGGAGRSAREQAGADPEAAHPGQADEAATEATGGGEVPEVDQPKSEAERQRAARGDPD